MNKQTEALKMAIEALKDACGLTPRDAHFCKAIQACKEALEQPAQEPVAWISESTLKHSAEYRNRFDDAKSWAKIRAVDRKTTNCDVPLYTHPAPQPAQEPVALVLPENRWYVPSPLDKDEKKIEFNRGFAQGFNDCILHVKLNNQRPLYTHPAPSWQGLSDDEIVKFACEYGLGTDMPKSEEYPLGILWYDGEHMDFARAIEQALKENNG